MAISRSQLVKELEPGLNALFGLEYNRYDNEHAEIFITETSDRAFEEEVMLTGFAGASIKTEGAPVVFDDATEAYTSRYTHQTFALAFAITEEAIEDNLYDRLAARYTRALARSMSQTKQQQAADILNNAFNSSFTGGDGVELCATNHPLATGGTFRNELSTAADLSETSLEQSLIDIAAFVDERGLKIALQGVKLIIPKELQFTAERVLKTPLSTTVGGTGDVLAGLCAGFLSKSDDLFNCACAAAFTNGAIGDILNKLMGYHFLASDMISQIATFLANH